MKISSYAIKAASLFFYFSLVFILQFTHITISTFESFGFIFGVNHLFFNIVFVTKTMIYSFPTTCPRLEGRGGEL